MASWSGIPELKEFYRTLGPLRFFSVMGVLALWIGSGVWLQEALGWPEAYDFRCSGKGCLFQDLWHSPTLLHEGKPLELLLFAHFMTVPAVLFASLGYALIFKFRNRRPRIVNDLLSRKNRDS